jgi:hypothetical protein
MRVLMLIAVIALAVAFLGAIDAISGVNFPAWLSGGLLAWALDVALGGYVLPMRRPPT